MIGKDSGLMFDYKLIESLKKVYPYSLSKINRNIQIISYDVEFQDKNNILIHNNQANLKL